MKIKLRPLLAKVLIYILLIGISLIMLIPFAWMLTSSFKMNKDVFTYPVVWWPKEFITSNYVRIWEEIPLLRYFFNTSKLTVLITILQLLTSTFAAYAFAKMKFPGKDFLFLSYICTIAMPWQSYMIPQFIIIKKMGLVNTHLALIILQSFTAFGVFLVRQFYMEIPNEICEAARIDGMSEYGIYAKIMLPLSKPVIATLTIFSFTTIWNDFMGPLIYINSQNLKTIQLGLRSFITEYSSEYSLIMAGSVVALIPVLIVFACLQKYFVEGIASTGLKG
ncbi:MULTISPECIES: carbohydrate ABC transporter permease [Eisenbergiella]|uniref:Carbohydrate ABC transporter permease n=1 Tax=Eisenbergiella massiliensis TaxID=1720294 RepID=A0A3E3IDG6_9FIRM|nr:MULTISPECIES: carbohydrate ABC transporter permease [Eisenbergiella]RGE65124.1 carbohydrate ABC transporter permease [Eisenbergiella massiliensis]RGE73074.1 carbohydrate ABC transporter permease [Eisenbergiella massiliensis]